MDEVANQLAQCTEQLSKLPPVVATDPVPFVIDLVTAFCGDVAREIEGSPEHPRLVQADKRAYESFRHAVRATAPVFVPWQRDPLPQFDDVETNDDEEGVEGEERGGAASSTASDMVYARNGGALYLEDVRARIEA